MKYQLRPYQQQAVERTREHIRSGRRSVLIVAPTGSGKTVISCDIIERSLARGSRTLFLAHRKELIEQCSAKLDEIGTPHGIVKAGNSRVDPQALVQVASVQTMKSRLEKLRQDYRLIIIDEAHHASADSYGAILKANPQAIILGLTATPYRMDGKGLADIFECLVQVTTIEALVAEGFLVPSKVFVGRQINLSGIRTQAGDYAVGELAKAVNKPKLVGDIVSEWRRLAGDRLTVCFTVNIEHSCAIRDAFCAAGIAAEHLDGTTDERERGAILARFAAGQTRIVCNCAVLTEGWDCPQASALILARPTKSRGLWRQMAGRVLRPAPGKTDCLILDHGNCTDYHGFLTDPDQVDLRGGVEIQKARPTRKCKVCGAKYAGLPPYCPMCGASLTDMAGRCDEPIGLGDRAFEMVEAKRREKPDRAAQQADSLKWIFLNDLKQARARGYKPGWAVGRYKSRVQGRPVSDEAMELARRRGLGIELRPGEDGKMQWQWTDRASAAA